MKLALFFLFSSLEYIIIFIIMFRLFRQRILIHTGKILFVCVFLTLLSHFIRYTVHLNEFAILIQIIAMIVALRFLWEYQWFYSMVMVVISYCSYLSINILTFYTMNALGIITMDQVQEPDGSGATMLGYVLQVITIAVSLVIIYLARNFNRGWAFIPDGEKHVSFNKKENRQLLIMCIMTAIVFGSILFLGDLWGNISLLITYTLMVIILAILFFFAYKKDVSEID